MNDDLFLASLAFFLTYLLHSTVLLGGLWLVLKARLVRSLATENGLWKAALLGGLMTAGLQSGLGFEPWSGFLPMGAPDRVAQQHAHRPASVVASARTSAAPQKFSAPALPGPPRVEQAERTLLGDELEPTPPRALPLGAWGALVAADALSRNEPSAAVAGTSSPTPAPFAADAVTHVPPVAAAVKPHISSPRSQARPQQAGSSTDPRSLTWSVAFGLWVALAGVGIARFVGLRLRLRRVLATRESVTDPALLSILERLRSASGLRGAVRLSTSRVLAGPIAVGRGEICLPPRAVTDLEPQRQEAMLAHEVAHLVRRDPLWLNICAVFEAMLFFQPLNRLASKRIQETAEFLCDDWAVAHTGRGIVLARCLAQVAAWIEESARPLPAAAMARPDSTLVQRVRRLAEGTPVPASKPLRAALLGVAVLGAVSCGVPGISANGRAGFLSRMVAAWHIAGDGGSSGSASTRAEDKKLTLIVEDGVIVGARLGDQEIDLAKALANASESQGDDGRLQVVLDISDGTEEPDAHIADDEWDEDDEWGEDEADWLDSSDSTVWDSRSLAELSKQMQDLEQLYARESRQRTQHYEQQLQQFQNECARTQHASQNQLQSWVNQWHQEFQANQAQRQHEWQRASEEANQELTHLQQEHRSNPSGYREAFEGWREQYDEALYEHEERWNDWNEEAHSNYEEVIEAFEDERDEQQSRWMDAQEELLDEREERFDDLEEWFEESYWELREAFEANIEARGTNPCDHDCKRRCRGGCTHPEASPEPLPEPEPCPTPEPEPRIEPEPSLVSAEPLKLFHAARASLDRHER